MNKILPAICFLLLLSALKVGSSHAQEDTAAPLAQGSGDRCLEMLDSPEGRASLLRYFGWLQTTSDEERTSQYKRVRSIASGGTPRAKLALALMLTLPNRPPADYERAKLLLEEFMTSTDEKDPEDLGLATLLLSLLNEVERLDAETDRLEAQLEQLQVIEENITDTEQSVNIPAPTPAPNDELKEENTSRR